MADNEPFAGSRLETGELPPEVPVSDAEWNIMALLVWVEYGPGQTGAWTE